MSTKQIDTVVVGGGQAGLAMSEHLGNHQVSHLVFEKSRIAEGWRTARWDSLVANGPAWHDCFPTMDFADMDPGAFASKDQVTRYFENFAQQIDAPIHCGVEVKDVRKAVGQPGFRLKPPMVCTWPTT